MRQVVLYVCNLCQKSYATRGAAVLHESAAGHTSFKLVLTN
jgi:hypothetical protein